MATPLLTTKVLIPPAGHNLVERPRLLAKLDESARQMLTLICAPAGYGKTTLLTKWVSNRSGSGDPASHPDRPPGDLSFCWLALDEADNDLARFLSYLHASLETLQAGGGGWAAAMVQTFPLPPLQTILTTWINALHELASPIVIILDDYQFISNTAIHEGLTFLLEHLPPNVHLVMATRSDPPLPLARLRARRQLVEIRAEDLRFSLVETTELLTQVSGVELRPEDVTRLEDRTEGWIAGLQMAALALNSISHSKSSDPAAYVESFSGSNRYILDYLVEEVLRHQPESIQAFLLQTSILDNLSGPLCDAVIGTGSGKADPAGPSGQHILEELERANLFLMPLDSERRWYRYHHLFADLLRARLEQHWPQQVSELHCRASQWYASQGLLAEAIAQALAAPDKAYAADLLEREILPFYYHSEITQVLRWLEKLPHPLISQRSLLCAVNAASMALLPPYPPDSLPAAEKWMQAAEHALPQDLQRGALARAFIYKIRSYWARFRGEPAEVVIQLIEDALSLLPVDSISPVDRNQLCIRSAAQTNLGMVYWTAGDEAAARQAFIQARQLSRAGGDLFNEAASIGSLARISFLHGQLGEAALVCQEALAFFDSQQAQFGHRAPYSGEIGVQLAEILIEQNRLAEAEQLLNDNIRLAAWTMGHNILVRGHLALARLAAVRGNPTAAFEHLDEAEKISSEGEGLAGAQRANLWLALIGQHPEYRDLARQWGQKHTRVEFRPGPPQVDWMISLALARLLLVDADSLPAGKAAAPRLEEQLAWLERQTRSMQARGWAHWQIRLGVIEALTRRAVGDKPGSLAALRQVLDLAAPGGYIHSFIDEGEPMRKLLQAYLQTSSPDHKAYARQLLAIPAEVVQAPPSKRQSSDLVEPLSPREIEILHWLAEGYSNRQVADKLILAEGTVKFYVHSLLEKLGVRNRAQAVIEAKKHKLV
jgi:LuxR family transcriptional regulator, maltose regulon positive regulatory protein